MFYIYPLVFPRGQTYAFAAEKAVNRNPSKTNRDHFFFVLPHVRAVSYTHLTLPTKRIV